MRPCLRPRLVNSPFDDPGLIVSFLYQRRAMLFDLGNLHALPARDILKISHIFISHAHMDHFIGFDHLLRLMLGRNKQIALFGPPGLIANVGGKLAAYTWNLTDNFKYALKLIVTDIHSDTLVSQRFDCQHRFQPITPPTHRPFSGIAHAEPAYQVHAVALDHGTASMAYNLRERFHINIRPECLIARHLTPGPWIQQFKHALYQQPSADASICIPGPGGARMVSVRALADQIALITPGQKICYIADAGYTPANIPKMTQLAKDADHLFIEAAFAHRHRSIAAQKFHLTARQAGIIAARAQAKQLTLFHFSPRYHGQADMLTAEARQAWRSCG